MRFLRKHAGLVTFFAIVGLLASIAIPNLLAAVDRSRQKRSMAWMRDIATAWEARATDFNVYTFGRTPPRNPAVMYRVKTRDMKRALEPKYVKTFPVKDGWDREFDFWVAGDGQTYAIRSRGADGRLDHQDIAAVGPTTNLDNDIVYSNGTFIEYPEGAG